MLPKLSLILRVAAGDMEYSYPAQVMSGRNWDHSVDACDSGKVK